MVFICQSHIVCFGSLSCSLVKGNNKLMSCTMWLLQHMRPQPMRLKWKSSMQALLHDMNYFIPYLLKCLKGNTTWANTVILLSLFFTDSSKVTRNGSCDGTMILGTSAFLCFHDSTCIPLATLKVYLRMDGHVLPNQNQHPVNTCMSRGSCKGLRTGLLMQPLLWNIYPLRTSISPEKWRLQDVFPIEIVPFSGTC